MGETAIEWTDMTWNPVTGCDKVSQGCKHCYAETLSLRLKAMGAKKYRNGFDVTLHPDELKTPYKWKKDCLVFVNSMSDLFHEDIPIQFIEQVFDVMADLPRHTFQVLTKRAARLACDEVFLPWPKNIWMGVSVEDSRVIDRIPHLVSTSAKVKFLSIEPLIGPIPSLPLKGIDWVIVGGESGQSPRPMHPAWVREIRDQCEAVGVPFFFKQWGGRDKKKAGRELDGRFYDAMPARG